MSDELFKQGLAVRREVLGEEYVDQSIADADEFSLPLQELVTKYCWGEIWTRPGLPRKSRSLINIAIMVALNRPHELKLHIRGAFRNGCTADEIQEVLLQSAIYVGVPAAVDAFRVAKPMISEMK